MKITEAMLIAYIDGELDAVARAEIDAQAKTDAEVAHALARCQAARAGAVEEPAPEELDAFIRDVAPHMAPQLTRMVGGRAGKPAEVVDLAALRAARAPKPSPAPASGLPRWAMAAASFICGVLAAGAFYTQAPGLLKAQGRALLAQGRLAQALNQDLASSPSAGSLVKVGLSFKAHDGGYCRTFSTTTGQALAGVACRERAGWNVRAAVFSGPSKAGQTTEPDPPTAILTEVHTLIDGMPLDASGEAAAKQAGWRPAAK